MRDRDHIQAGRGAIPEERRQHPLAHIEAPGSGGAAVHQKPRTFRQLHEDRVALTYVEDSIGPSAPSATAFSFWRVPRIRSRAGA